MTECGAGESYSLCRNCQLTVNENTKPCAIAFLGEGGGRGLTCLQFINIENNKPLNHLKYGLAF